MIAACDPGSTTGVATYDGVEFVTFQIEHKKYPHPHEVLYDTLSSLNPEKIIYEAFLHRHKTGVIYEGVQYSGVIELWGEIHGVPVVKYSSSQGKAFWKDDKIKKLGLWKPGHPHGMDALRHLLTDLVDQDVPVRWKLLNALKED